MENLKPYLKKKTKKGWQHAQAVSVPLPSKHEALNSNSSTIKKETRKKRT
jgi:hypothetical protein